MTCAHCEASVAEEVERLEGVATIDVDREAGRLAVRGDGFTDGAVRLAVEQAGSKVVGS